MTKKQQVKQFIVDLHTCQNCVVYPKNGGFEICENHQNVLKQIQSDSNRIRPQPITKVKSPYNYGNSKLN